MNRKEFQQWLDQFDENTIIECVMHTSGHGYYDQGGNATTEEFNPQMDEFQWCTNSQCEYTDFTGNQFVDPNAAYFGKKYLLIGGKDV